MTLIADSRILKYSLNHTVTNCFVVYLFCYFAIDNLITTRDSSINKCTVKPFYCILYNLLFIYPSQKSVLKNWCKSQKYNTQYGNCVSCYKDKSFMWETNKVKVIDLKKQNYLYWNFNDIISFCSIIHLHTIWIHYTYIYMCNLFLVHICIVSDIL